jgi:predicted aspartyl protease
MIHAQASLELIVGDVGTFRTTIGIEDILNRGTIVQLENTLVDTGSEFTWVPRSVLEKLGITPQRRQTFVVADGRQVEREMGWAIVHAAGLRTPDTVVFAEEGDFVLLGVHTLEGLNLRIDVVAKRLVEAGPILAAPAIRRAA